jgi:hypothetical protein
MAENCDMEHPNCGLIVGDLVDWKHTATSVKKQTRFWHGQIVDRWNTEREGHWFVVRWDISDKQGRYRRPRRDLDRNFIPHSPHYWQEQCHELKRCGEIPALHPTVNELPPHP